MAIVHRDISPQNVLVSEQGEVKLTDFGIAKAMGRREQTSQGVIKGKLAFMSPEQASGRDLDSRSDLFSLGTMLYVLFTGHRPFHAPTDLEAILRVRQCQFTPADVLAPELDPQVVRIIHRAMQAAPEKRYQSAEEMLLDIEGVQRSVYKPAGQTELKRWLADLSERDHATTVSRQRTLPLPPKITQELDMVEGADLVFEESVVQEFDSEKSIRETLPTVATTPPKLPEPPVRSEKAPVVATPVAAEKRHRTGRSWIFLALLGVGVMAAWRFGFSDSGHSTHPEKPPKLTENTAAVKDKENQLAIHDEPLKASDSTPNTEEIALPAGPTMAPSPAPDAIPAALAEQEADDEEALLKTAEPADGDRVLGEEEGIPLKKKPIRKDAAPKVAPNWEPVSVHIVTVPEGSVIKLGKRVFGRAPMNLRFRPGITYKLTFIKQGFEPKTTPLLVSKRKNQSLKVILKKISQKGAVPKKSLLKRIFGK